MTPAFRLILIWIAGSLIAFMLAMNLLSASFVDGHYIPISNDSFYHARRILDAVANGGVLYEFDRFIHYPEGSWLTWPWGYDWLMAQIVRGEIALLGPREPMSVLAYVPVFSLTITMALVLAISGVLRLSMPLRALLVLCFAVSPLTQGLYGVGMLDHHFAEQIFVLLSIWLTMLWLRGTRPVLSAVALGCALGAAVTIHNGLFILQLPVIAALALLWLRGSMPESRSITWFAVALALSTLLVALPAAALRQGEFQYYLLSWFHVYVAACTAILAVLLSRWQYTRRHLAWITVIAALMVVPVVAQVISGGEFVTGNMEALKGIDEARSLADVALKNPARIAILYGMFGWLAPVAILFALVQLRREPRSEMVYFWICSLLMLALLVMQMRFQNFGSLALYAIPLVAMEKLRERRPASGTAIALGACALVALAFIPSFRSQLFLRLPPGLDADYANTRKLYPVLAAACRDRAGVALGTTDQGHYIRYHTDCPVIANNFRLTPQHLEKVQRVEHLYSLSPEQLLAEAPELHYIVATMDSLFEARPDNTLQRKSIEALKSVNSRLNVELLLTDVSKLPARYKMIHEIVIDDATPLAIARVFEILPPDPAPDGNGPT
jgi:hypothetical protein